MNLYCSAEASTSNEPHAPPRSRRTSEQSIHIDINAASAVAGGIAANQDLPYMTPPINPSNQQVNFSGDSQDSSSMFYINSNVSFDNLMTFFRGIY